SLRERGEPHAARPATTRETRLASSGGANGAGRSRARGVGLQASRGVTKWRKETFGRLLKTATAGGMGLLTLAVCEAALPSAGDSEVGARNCEPFHCSARLLRHV